MRYSACIEMLFKKFSFTERIEKASEVGFDAVEFWSWSDKNISEIRDTAQKSGVSVCAFCADTADLSLKKALSDGGLLKHENVSLFAEEVAESCETAKFLGADSLIVTTGNALSEVADESQVNALTECLSAGGKIASQYGITLVLEPLNQTDHKGYYLSSSLKAFKILKDVANANVKLLFDVYHQQITEGNLITNITENIDNIGHFHIADVPGRHQPGSGEINYDNVFRAIDFSGYNRYIGCEFTPSDGLSSEESVKALKLKSK